MAAVKRQHPRFASRTEVELSLPGRPELGKFWTSDMSKGGMFIATPEPPPLRTKLFVTIKLPEGHVRLEAEVVHVVDVESATKRQTRSGVGVQFTHLGAAERTAVNNFVDGLAAKIAVDAVYDAGAAKSGTKQDERVMSFLNAMRRDDVYAALEIPPLSSAIEVQDRLGELSALFTSATGTSPVQKTRLETANRMLEQVRNLLLDPESRIDFEFRHELLFVEDRVRMAPNPKALALLRKVWRTRFPEEAELGEGCWLLALRAHGSGDLAAAIRHGFDAIEGDPFSLETREKLARWVTQAQGPGPRLRSPTLPSFAALPRA